jgi:hypothetical protein
MPGNGDAHDQLFTVPTPCDVLPRDPPKGPMWEPLRRNPPSGRVHCALEPRAVQTLPRRSRWLKIAPSQEVTGLPEAEAARAHLALLSELPPLVRLVEVEDRQKGGLCRGYDGLEIAAREGGTYILGRCTIIENRVGKYMKKI